MNFYAVFPSPIKNQFLARSIYYNEKEQIQRKRPNTEEESKGSHSPARKRRGGEHENEDTPTTSQVFFPIRGIDFDPATMTLYTGDEAGYMQKWDLSTLLGKLKEVEEAHIMKQE